MIDCISEGPQKKWRLEGTVEILEILSIQDERYRPYQKKNLDHC